MFFTSRAERERRETIALRDRVRRAFDASPLARADPTSLALEAAIAAFELAGRELPDEPSEEPFLSIGSTLAGLAQEEDFFAFPAEPPGWERDLAAGVNYRNALRDRESYIAAAPAILEAWRDTMARAFGLLLSRLPELPADAPDDGAYPLTVPLADVLHAPGQTIGSLVATFAATEHALVFPVLRARIMRNLYAASGIEHPERSAKSIRWPEDRDDLTPAELVDAYLGGTAIADFLAEEVPFSIPFRARFEHTHIVGGSGHGKTQLLQHLLLRDLDRLRAGRGSIVVIDSQGDMLRTITRLAELSPTHEGGLADRLVLIDPNDVEHPPALNLFDFGLERLSRYNPAEREKLINGAVALYEYLFGALLGAELTQRQGVIFRYLARLMMTVPGATIHTLMEFMENPDATRAHFDKLDRITRHFFETQFFSPSFKDTRQQILTRLWGVLSNSVLARMFAHERNKLDLFEAMNRGSLILINTAKDLLKQEGCEILGRFFIALISQAAQERASIPDDRRRSTFVYIDEAHDYFDESIESLLNQARKYHVGIILAHQNLDQFEQRLRATVMASTSIKMVGGLSAKDASAFSKEMRCEPEFLQCMRKHRNHTEFACFVRNHTQRPIRLAVPFGEMERRPAMSVEDHAALIERNRSRYAGDGAAPAAAAAQPIDAATPGSGLVAPELL